VVARQKPEAWAAIAERDAPILLEGRDWSVDADGEGMTYRNGERELRLPLPPLLGPHQIATAGQAIACLEVLGIGQPDLAGTVWPGRLQRLESGALVESLPSGCELWLDGGHNADAGAALAAHAADAWRDRPLALVVGMLDSKSPDAFLAPLVGLADHAVAIAIPGQSNSLSPGEIPGCKAADSLMAAIGSCPAGARILVCGSLYLVGQALAENGTPPG
jgi:dihydrofolate synthase/folylpolyglutamate synthase